MRTMLAVAIAILFCCAWGGCGGGTGGTGDIGGSTHFFGTVRSIDGKPLAAVEVTVAETGDSTRSNGDGSFMIIAQLPDDEPQLIVRGDTFDQVIAVGKLDDLESDVFITVSVDSVNNAVSIREIEISPRAESTPPPTPASNSSMSSSSAAPRPAAQSSLFRGQVVDESGKPLRDVTLTIIPQKGRTKTDGAGKFRIEAPQQAGPTRIEVSSPQARGTISLGDLPDYAVSVTVKIIITVSRDCMTSDTCVSQSGSKLSVSSLSVRRR